jgi:hypothetical protein
MPGDNITCPIKPPWEVPISKLKDIHLTYKIDITADRATGRIRDGIQVKEKGQLIHTEPLENEYLGVVMNHNYGNDEILIELKSKDKKPYILNDFKICPVDKPKDYGFHIQLILDVEKNPDINNVNVVTKGFQKYKLTPRDDKRKILDVLWDYKTFIQDVANYNSIISSTMTYLEKEEKKEELINVIKSNSNGRICRVLLTK